YQGYYEALEELGRPDVSPLQNIWLGVTAENQEQADKRIPLLLQTPAAHRFVSIEPMLGTVDLEQYLIQWQCPECKEWNYGSSFCDACGMDQWENLDDAKNRGLDWVIVGCETGPGRRLMSLDWVRSIRDQCQAAGVPLWIKGLQDALVNGKVIDDMAEWPEDLRIRQLPW
ncbi:MAG: DUF5131 family protein, partial [Dehalococcoidales bacterium]|nr:DUF5131 family protein [Dehalococcoidales bacterium]